MNPELPSPQFTPEQPLANGGQEYAQALPNPETFGERSPEREQYMQSVDKAPVLPPPPPMVAPMPAALPSATPQPVVPADDNPVLAADDDLIEKEWVDKAKQIIATTHDDPYKREQEVNKLQADYLFKRYGKELGSPQ
ncbi:hypothetical protein I8H84_03735 [Candidatus Saccharibacteria bacterium]|nr:hypothetical protein [Candidatus Saccharibacteria bacterium]MBH1973052.1 hypothetical protein [Candidatus Saccharibacteria bacterium]MBH1990706.1 hypothetical protein [Candidatus Saccharibacteria bacterium]